MPGLGKLVLKGGIDLSSKTKSLKKHKKRKRHRDDTAAPSASSSKAVIPTKQPGSGRLISSGTTITGTESTKFMDELSPGDAIIVRHPTTLQEEIRIVTMVLSNSSMSISSEFSSSLISGTKFEFLKRPKEAADPMVDKAAKKRKNADFAKDAFGTYAGGSGGRTITYRRKKQSAYGGYEIVTEKTDKQMSREEMLDLRCGRKSDRHAY